VGRESSQDLLPGMFQMLPLVGGVNFTPEVLAQFFRADSRRATIDLTFHCIVARLHRHVISTHRLP